MVACSLTYCIFANMLVKQLYDALSMMNIDSVSKSHNSSTKRLFLAWRVALESCEPQLSNHVYKHTYTSNSLGPFYFSFPHTKAVIH